MLVGYKKYLKEFLSDRRVIEVNPIIWQIILNLFILTFRPSKTAHTVIVGEKKVTNTIFILQKSSNKTR